MPNANFPLGPVRVELSRHSLNRRQFIYTTTLAASALTASSYAEARALKFDVAYKDHPRTGYIGLQDHGSPCWFKNIKLRPLGP